MASTRIFMCVFLEVYAWCMVYSQSFFTERIKMIRTDRAIILGRFEMNEG